MKKGWIILGIFIGAFCAEAADFTLVNNHTGARFFCNSGGGGGGGQAPDPQCVQDVASYCNRNTSLTSNACFDRATNACSGAGSGFASCVSSSASYCNTNTSFTSNECFDRALQSCSGNFEAVHALMEGVRAKALADVKSRN